MPKEKTTKEKRAELIQIGRNVWVTKIVQKRLNQERTA